MDKLSFHACDPELPNSSNGKYHVMFVLSWEQLRDQNHLSMPVHLIYFSWTYLSFFLSCLLLWSAVSSSFTLLFYNTNKCNMVPWWYQFAGVWPNICIIFISYDLETWDQHSQMKLKVVPYVILQFSSGKLASTELHLMQSHVIINALWVAACVYSRSTVDTSCFLMQRISKLSFQKVLGQL